MDFKFKKKYGQNFLKNEATILKIINSIDIEEDDLIIEIGPGSGALTKYLANLNNNVICYEIDSELNKYLNKYESDHLKIIYDDFMKRDFLEDIKDYDYNHIIFIGNLPYYITTPIILKIMDNIIPSEMVFMVQKEVAERFSSKPKNREYGSITVLFNYYFYVHKEFIVNRSEFVPSPNVDSAIIKFNKKEEALNIDQDKFNCFLHDAFQFKRKNLRNNLRKYDLEKVDKILNKNGYSLDNRAEDLPVEVFVEIVNNI